MWKHIHACDGNVNTLWSPLNLLSNKRTKDKALDIYLAYISRLYLPFAFSREALMNPLQVHFIGRLSCLLYSFYKKVNISTTFNGGSLGSCIDEERSELRYVMWIAEFSESSNLWTHIALQGLVPVACLFECQIPFSGLEKKWMQICFFIAGLVEVLEKTESKKDVKTPSLSNDSIPLNWLGWLRDSTGAPLFLFTKKKEPLANTPSFFQTKP